MSRIRTAFCGESIFTSCRCGADGVWRGGICRGPAGGNAPAIKGYDPVAYFTKSAPALGNQAFAAEYEGQRYLFAPAAHRDAFMQEPAKYAPQYGGFCVYGATRGYKAAIDPASFTVRDGKLNLNHSANVQSLWEKDVPGYIKLADDKWPETSGRRQVAEDKQDD